jgi:hypothetical protein
MMRYDATSILPTIKGPTLVVTGDRDITTWPVAGEAIARGAPKGELTALSPARHMGLVEHDDRLDALVGAFVDPCPGPRDAGGTKGRPESAGQNESALTTSPSPRVPSDQ